MYERSLFARVETAALMVRQHGVTVAQAAACLRVPIVLVNIALGTWSRPA